jgi:histidine ammonia-lyase
VIEVDGQHLSWAQISAVADGEAVHLSPAGRDRARASHDYAVAEAMTRAIYGRSTGVGSNRDVLVTDPMGTAGHGSRLLHSHATAAGPLRSARRVRATMAIRLNQLAAGGSGVAPGVLDGLVALISADGLPSVRELGGIGTADLAALATIGLALDAATAPGAEIGLDALGFISSSAASLADATLAGSELAALLRAGLVVAALSFVAISGNSEAFAPVVETVTPFAGARQVCRALRALVPPNLTPARIQDPFALRALPQSHGVAIDGVATLVEVTTAMSNAPSENPVLLPGRLAHHGGFQATYLAAACDTLALAVAQAAELTLSRLSTLTEPAYTGLAPFLAGGPPGSSGVMVLEYVAADALGRLRSAAAPASLQSVTISRGAESGASYASLAAAKLFAVAEAYRVLIAAELVTAVRALRMSNRTAVAQSSAPLARVLSACDVLDAATADRDLTADLTAADRLVPALAAFLAI